MDGRSAFLVRLVWPLALAFLFGCKESSTFAGSGGVAKKDEPKAEETPSDPAKRKPPRKTEDQRVDVPKEDDPGNLNETEEVVWEPKEGAVVEGRFAAWTEPTNPRPLQPYWIHIEVLLPNGITTYSPSDLSGFVTGTDDYKRGLGRESRGAFDPRFLPPFLANDPVLQDPALYPQDQFQFSGNTARIAVWVPGGASLVRDVITIQSDLLKESATLTIVFQ